MTPSKALPAITLASRLPRRPAAHNSLGAIRGRSPGAQNSRIRVQLQDMEACVAFVLIRKLHTRSYLSSQLLLHEFHASCLQVMQLPDAQRRCVLLLVQEKILQGGTCKTPEQRAFKRIAPKCLDLSVVSLPIAKTFCGPLLQRYLTQMNYLDPVQDWPKPIEMNMTIPILLEDLVFLGDTRSRHELLVFAQASQARLPLAMGPVFIGDQRQTPGGLSKGRAAAENRRKLLQRPLGLRALDKTGDYLPPARMAALIAQLWPDASQDPDSGPGLQML